MSMTDTTSSSNASDRVRRYRVRKREGRHVARVEIGPKEIEALVSNGLLAAGDEGDRAAISEAIGCMLFALSEGAVEIDFDRFIEAVAQPN